MKSGRVIGAEESDARSLAERILAEARREAAALVTDAKLEAERLRASILDAALTRAHAHRQLVAEVAGGRLAHAGHAQVLAQRRGLLQVEVVERHHAVDGDPPGQMAGAEDEVVEPPLLVVVVNEEDIVQTLARPVGVAQAL